MINLPPPTRVAFGQITIAGVQHEVFLSREWSRYFDSLNTLSEKTANVAASAQITAQAAASISFDNAGQDGTDMFVPVAGKDGEAGKDGAVIFLPQDAETIEYYWIK